jgi:uncharacterized protein (DUF697 family)
LNTYETWVLKELRRFEAEIYKDSQLQGWTKQIQQRLDGLIPKRVHQSLASALEKGIKGFLAGIHETDDFEHRYEERRQQKDKSLHDLVEEAERAIDKYRKIASVEGAGTGFGGLIASAIDFPALISIKLKLLQELALIYGYDTRHFEERLYIITVLQLQFSGKEAKRRTWEALKVWLEKDQSLKHLSWPQFDWESFYMEYKQSIEVIKLFQIIPGFGAIVGGLANYTYLNDLGKTAMLCYQMRRLKSSYPEEWDMSY